MGSFEVCPTSPGGTSTQWSCCQDGESEEQQFPATGQFGTINKGLYGVNLNYILKVTNSGAEVFPFNLGLLGRNNGGVFVGAAQPIIEGFNFTETYPQMGVPPITGTPTISAPGAIDLLQGGFDPMPIAAFVTHGYTATTKIAVGGVAATPFNLYAGRIAYTPTEGGGGD